MTDDEFLRELEACMLSEREFGHHAHVRAAYLYLGQSNFAEALVRMRRSICAYATHLGRPHRYHETITIAHLALIQRCIVEHGDRGGWAMFSRSNPDLLDPGLLGRIYDRDLLESSLARRVFLFPRANPDRGGSSAGIDLPRP
jgi:hypothetical protein